MKRPAQSASRPAARQGPQRLGNAALVLGLGLLSACAEKPLQVAQPVAALRAELDAARARASAASAARSSPLNQRSAHVCHFSSLQTCFAHKIANLTHCSVVTTGSGNSSIVVSVLTPTFRP